MTGELLGLDALALCRKLTGEREAVEHLAEVLAEHLRPPTLYTCQSLAAEVGCSPEAIGRAIRCGELPATRRAGRWIIRAVDAELWAETGERPAIRARRDRPGRGRRKAGVETPGSSALLNAGRDAA